MMLLACLAVASVLSSSAQTVADNVAAVRIINAELSALQAKAPKETKVGDVDKTVVAALAAATGAVASAEKLDGFYKRELGQTEDGVTDVTVTKPKLEDWVELGTTVGTEAAGLGTLTKSITDATKSATSAGNPMQKAKAVKATKWLASISAVLGKSTAAQGKAIKEIVETLKSGKNL